MAENAKRVIKVSFNGKEKLEERVFDTTYAENAKKFGLFDPKRKYGPLVIITGEHELLPLVEKELEQMKVGEEKTIKMTSKESFGERRAELVRVVPLKVFLDQKLNPIPGLVISVGNAYGKVQSVSGGRVRVDFNHPLAGRDVEYEVKVEEEILDKKGRAEILFEKYYSFVPGSKKEIAEEKLVVSLGKDTMKNLEKINESIKRLGKDLGVAVEFKEVAEQKGAKGKETSEKEAEEAHLHKHSHECDDPECSHTHAHNQSEEKCNCAEGEECICEEGKCECVPEKKVEEKARTKSINRVFDEIKTTKRGAVDTEVRKDSATTIQRPKKKQ